MHLTTVRLAGAVVADECHDLAGMQVEVDVVQHVDRAEALVDLAQLQYRLSVQPRSTPLTGRQPRDDRSAGLQRGRARPVFTERAPPTMLARQVYLTPAAVHLAT